MLNHGVEPRHTAVYGIGYCIWAVEKLDVVWMCTVAEQETGMQLWRLKFGFRAGYRGATVASSVFWRPVPSVFFDGAAARSPVESAPQHRDVFCTRRNC